MKTPCAFLTSLTPHSSAPEVCTGLPLAWGRVKSFTPGGGGWEAGDAGERCARLVGGVLHQSLRLLMSLSTPDTTRGCRGEARTSALRTKAHSLDFRKLWRKPVE